MSKLLYGDKVYSWGTKPNPPTPKQWSIIGFIQRTLGIRFTGKTSKEAYKFCGKYFDEAHLKAYGRLPSKSKRRW